MPEHFLHNILHPFGHALLITAFVISMMTLIEYISVISKIKKGELKLNKSWVQIIFSAFLGIIPGCLGTFTAVSLYTKQIINFPALVVVMIATSGDEAFVMFNEIPGTAFLIMLILFLTAIFVGFILNIFFKDKKYVANSKRQINQQTIDISQLLKYKNNNILRTKYSIYRVLIILLSTTILLYSVIKIIGGEFNDHTISITIISLIIIFISLFTTKDFIKDLFWKHVVKTHLINIFLWTFGALLFVEILIPLFETQLSVKLMTEKYYIIILLIAILLGIIPTSGVNMVFIFLFSAGHIPLSILIANSIVQDGHGSLPLLAESRKQFIYTKIINIAVGLLFGVVGLLLHF